MGSATAARRRIRSMCIAPFVSLVPVLTLATFPAGCGEDGGDAATSSGGSVAIPSSGGTSTGGSAPSTGGQVAPAGGTGAVNATGGSVATTGTGGTSGGVPASGGTGGTAPGTGGTPAPAGGATQAGGAAPGGTGNGGSSGGAAGGAAACAHACLDQCTNGTQQPGTCDGAKVCCQSTPPTNPLSHLSASAQQIGLLLANRFSKQALAFSSVANLPGDGYKTACEWYGALGVAKLTNSSELLNALVSKFDPLKSNFVMAMTSGESHVDRYIFGMVPLEIYLQTNDMSYLPLGTQVADRQITSDQTRDAIDDMFMMTGLQLEAYRATKDAKYIDFMSKTMVKYLGAQQANGLFFHNVQEAKVHWGRGNGWFAAGMAEIMRDLPSTSADYMTIEAGYKRMMEGLKGVQSANGLWYQVLDQGTNAQNWEESSGSAMFTYAMVAGIRRGILDAATYVPVVDKAWAALQKKISPQGDVSDICIGTWYKANAAEYMALTRLTGDGHGQAPVLWAAAELLK